MFLTDTDKYTEDVNLCQALMRYTGSGVKNLEKNIFVMQENGLSMANQGFDFFCFLLREDSIKSEYH